jgi:hypothetical protein
MWDSTGSFRINVHSCWFSINFSCRFRISCMNALVITWDMWAKSYAQISCFPLFWISSSRQSQGMWSHQRSNVLHEDYSYRSKWYTTSFALLSYLEFFRERKTTWFWMTEETGMFLPNAVKQTQCWIEWINELSFRRDRDPREDFVMKKRKEPTSLSSLRLRY